MTAALQTNATLSPRAERNERFLRNIYERGPFQGHAFCVNPPQVPGFETPRGAYTLTARPLTDWVPWVLENYRRQVEWHAALADDGLPVARLICGTHLYAAAFGCRVHTFTDSQPCALPFIRTPEEADRIEEPDIWKSPTLYRVFELGEAVRRELGPEAFLGPCDMQSGFDTASLIWNKEDLLCALAGEEEERAAVKRLVDKCARLYKRFLQELRREFPRMSWCHCPSAWSPPEMGPWLSNDECGAFGVEMFEEFCLPELVDLAETFGGLGMHCCALAEHQFPSFKRIPNFYAFNRVAAKGGPGYPALLTHFAGPTAPVHVLGWVEETMIRRLVTEAPAGTRFIFQQALPDLEAAGGWLERMRALSPRQD